MRKKGDVGFFGKIDSRDDALAMIRYVTVGFYFLAGVLVIMAVYYQSTVWVDAVVYTLLAYLLRRFNSRSVAILLLVISVGLFFLTFTNAIVIPVRGRNAVVGFFMVISSIRAIEATFKLNGSLAQPEL